MTRQRGEIDKPMRGVRGLQFGLLLAICLAYSNSFHNGFHFDDFHTIVDNSAIQSLRNVPRFFEDATTFSVLPANRTYRPVVTTSLAVDYALGRGYNPLWFHVGTFVLFLAMLALLALFFHEVMDRTKPSSANIYLAWFGAAWFGLHPATAETINYIIQRGDLYCTLGVVAALVVFVRFPQQRRYGVYLLPLLFALLSKPPAAIFPVLLFFYVFFFEAEEHPLKNGILWAMPSAALVGLLLWLQAVMTPKTFLASTTSPWDYRMTQPYVLLRYLGEFFLPLRLNVDSDLVAIHGIDMRVTLGFMFLALLCTLIVYTAKREELHPVAYGLIWFLAAQIPTSLYPLSEVENDHRMFFSFVGLVLAAAWTMRVVYCRFTTTAQRRSLRPIMITLVVLLLSGFGYGTHTRNRVWFNEETLWRDDVDKSPHNGRGLMIYGLTQMDKGDYPTALRYFTRALDYTPNYATLEINLGIVNGAIADSTGGHADLSTSAEHHFLRAISLAPADDQTHAYYGRWLKDHDRLNEAVQQLRIAIALDPQRPMQHDALIEAYATAGDIRGALRAARETSDIMPGDELAARTLRDPPVLTAAFWVNLSLAQYQSGHYVESAESARRALLLEPNSAEAWNNLGAADAALHLWTEAIEAARKAIALKPDFQLARNNLAWALSREKHDSLHSSRSSQ